MVSKTSIANDTHPIFQCARAQSALQEPHEQQPPSLSDPMKHCDATLVQHYVRRCVCVFGGPQVKCHGTTYCVTAQLTFSRHNLLSHGTTYFLTAQLAFSRHNLLSHGTTYFLHGTIYFLAAQFTFSPGTAERFCDWGG